MALFVIGSIREILGSRTILGFQVLPNSYDPMIIMILPAGAFLTYGLLMGFSNAYAIRKNRKAAETNIFKYKLEREKLNATEV